ncbi:MAG TPA: hypothetical protein VH917_04595 [Ignavibacteriaceae bacterium]
MSSPENHAGFNITKTVLQVAETGYDGDVFKLLNLNEAKFDQPLNFNTDKDAIITARLQTAFDAINLKNPITSKAASFTLPLETFLTFQVPFENSLLYSDQLEEFRWELSVLYPHIPADELVIQYFEIEKNMVITKNTALVLAFPRRFINLLNKFCSSNNLVLKFVDHPHLAADLAINFSSESDTKGLSLSVYISKKNFSLLFILDDRPVYIRVFPFQEFSDIIKILTDHLNPSVNKNINKDLLTNAYVCGEDVPDELISYLKNTLKINFKKFNPFSKIKPGAGMAENIYFRQNFNSFAPAAGISYRVA